MEYIELNQFQSLAISSFHSLLRPRPSQLHASFLSTFLFFLVFSMLSSFAESAPSVIRMGSPQISGTGCSPQTSSVALSPDGNELSILYDDYRAGTVTSEQNVRKNCRVIIPLTLPTGYQLRITQADYRGFNSLPEKARSEFLAEYSFQGEDNRETRKLAKFQGPLVNEFYEVHRVHSKSPCQSQTQFIVNTELRVENQNLSQNASIEIDTLDIVQPARRKDRRTKFQVNILKCNSFRPFPQFPRIQTELDTANQLPEWDESEEDPISSP